MRLFFILWTLIFLCTGTSFQAYSQEEKPIIISRQQWWADESYWLLDSTHWKDILEKRKNISKQKPKNPELIKKHQEKTKRINKYLNSFFADQFNIVEKKYSNKKWQRYAWPREYMDYVDSIILHHTHSEYDDSFEWIKKIYKYHSLTRQWWDIWYNYLIWYDWEIFEWRAWWDYVAGAHSKYNNRHSIWISIIWDYHTRWINSKQYESLEKLIQYLVQKYWIDLSKKIHYHSRCAKDACKIFPIETFKSNALVWHRDTGHTSCPWDKLYAQMQEIWKNNLFLSKGLEPVSRNDSTSHNINSRKTSSKLPDINKVIKILSKLPREKKLQIQKELNKKLSEDNDKLTIKKLQIVKIALKISLSQNATK